MGAHAQNVEEQCKFSFLLLKTQINLINFNKPSTYHFAKVTLHVFTELHVKFVNGVEWGTMIVLS